MRLTFFGCCETGLVRSTNEDAVLMRSSNAGGLFLVADGIGGRAHGEVVSALLRNCYAQWWQEQFLPKWSGMDLTAALSSLKSTLFQVNRQVVGRFGELTAGSTLALLFLFRGACVYLSVGDSRIYHARGLSFQQVTLDDTCKDRDGAEKLVSAVGIHSTPEFRVSTSVLRGGSKFLLCSDGVYRFVNPIVLRRTMLLLGNSPQRAVESLSTEVERNGARDNYSMIYVHVRSK